MVDSLPEFTTFSNVLCDAEYESDSSDDQSSSDEDVLEKIILKPLSEEEIIPMKSLRTHDSSLLISSNIDSLFEEFAGELTLLKSIPPGIDETDCDFKEDIRLIEKLLYDNSSPHPSEEFISANSDAKIKSFSPSLILDYDSKKDILIRKDLPRNNTLSFAEKESFHFDIASFSRPPAKPPDGDTEILNIKMIEIRLTKRLLYDKSSPRPLEEIVSDNSNADIESFSPSHIPNEDSDSHMEEIDLSFNPDVLMPPGIEEDDYDSERDIPILEKLIHNYSLSLPANESYHFDIPSPYRPPAKPP
nr:hypothetical protein [Tanacetum cinerariifolium]